MYTSRGNTSDEITRTQNSPLELFYSSLRAEATKTDYDRKLRKVLCEFFKPILKGDPELVKRKESEPKTKKQGVKRQFSDADFEAMGETLGGLMSNTFEGEFDTNVGSSEETDMILQEAAAVAGEEVGSRFPSVPVEIGNAESSSQLY